MLQCHVMLKNITMSCYVKECYNAMLCWKLLPCHVMSKNVTMSCYVEECARDLGVVST